MANDSKNEKRAEKVESLVTTPRQDSEDDAGAPKKAKANKNKAAKKGSKNIFLAPSVMMFIICGIAILISLIAFVNTSWRISRAVVFRKPLLPPRLLRRPLRLFPRLRQFPMFRIWVYSLMSCVCSSQQIRNGTRKRKTLMIWDCILFLKRIKST